MHTYNQTFYDLFMETADLLAITGGGFFQVRAYQEAARMLKEETVAITKQNADLKMFEDLPRIGKALALKMMEYIETGKMEYLENLRAQVPEGVRELLKIPGLGPKRIGLLYLTAGVTTKEQLIKKAEAGELEKLPGLGKKSVQKILDAIGHAQEKKKRHKRSEVEPFVKKILNELKNIPEIDHAEAAGSYRRGAPTVGDLDILVVMKSTQKKNPPSSSPENSDSIRLIENEILPLFPNHTILGSGDTKLSFMIFPENLQIDIRSVPVESYGAALLYFTGSKDFNVNMRRIAIGQGALLNEYGLMKKGEIVAGKTEEEVFEALEMKYVEPEKRR